MEEDLHLQEGHEEIPLIITDDFFTRIQSQVESQIKEFREQGRFKFACDLLHILSTAENLQTNVKNEQAKVEKLMKERLDAQGTIEEAMRISQKDRDTIGKLREEVVEAWNHHAASERREVGMAEKLNELRKKYEKAQEDLKKFSRKFDDQDINPLGKHKNSILQECERLTEEVRELNKRLQVQRAYSDEVQKKLDDSNEKSRELYREWDEATNDNSSCKKKNEQLTIKTKELEEELDKTTESMTHFKTVGEERLAKIKKQEHQLAEMTENLENLRNVNEKLTSLKLKLQTRLKSSDSQVEDLKHELGRLKNFMRLKEDENRILVIDNESYLKKIDAFIRKVAAAEENISKKKIELQNQRTETLTAEKERDTIRRINDTINKDNEQLHKKILALMREVEKREEIIAELKKEKSQLEDAKILLAIDLKQALLRESHLVQNVKNLKANYDTVQSERDYLKESSKELEDELKEKQELIEKMKSDANDVKNQLAHFKHEYDVVVKQLKDSRTDFQRCHEKEYDLQDRWEKSTRQIEDINNKLTIKVAEIASLEKKIKSQDKKIRELNHDLEQCRGVIHEAREEIKTIKAENKNLREAARENEARMVTMKCQMDKILRERDLIACQMVRRTDESDLLTQEVSTLKLTIDRGNGMYNDRLDDIKLLTNEIKNLRSQGICLKRGLQNTADMRHEVFQLHRELNQERTKSNVLEQEMATPMNVHRWRKLYRFDPKQTETMKKLQKSQRWALLQSTKILKAEEIIKTLQEKIERIENEKTRVTCVEAQTKLMVARSKLDANTKRMKAAIAVSRAADPERESKDHIICQLQSDLADLKSQFYKVKQEKLKLSEKLRNSGKTKDGDESKEKFKNLGNEIIQAMKATQLKRN